MGFAVELYFDRATEAAVRMLRQDVYASGIAPFVDALGDRPHVSLAAFHDLDVAATVPILQAFASEVPPFSVSLSAVGFFPTEEGVVFLAPTPTRAILGAHARLHQHLQHAGMGALPYTCRITGYRTARSKCMSSRTYCPGLSRRTARHGSQLTERSPRSG